jgi:hypothetical protein
LDNASNNIKSTDYFIHSLNSIMDEKIFHKKYAYHIFHLTVKTGIETPDFDQLIMKYKDSHHHIYSINIKK